MNRDVLPVRPRVLVTGGAGFIGSHFVRSALRGEYPGITPAELVVLDKLTYAGRLENLAPVAGDDRMRFVHGDICDARLVEDVMTGVDLVVHFAAESHVDRSIAGSDAFTRTNVLGTQVLLSAALRAGVRRFTHVSTDEVYGSINEGSWAEDAPLEPNSPYAASKASSDLLVRAYHRTHGLPVCVTRCPNNYGPHQFPEKIIPLFVSNLLDGRPVPLYGDGLNVREWLHVDDHCRAVALVAERGRPGEVYNVGPGTPLSNLELTRLLLEAVGADASMVMPVADRKGHDRRYAVDATKIAGELGFTPRVPFGEGLAATVAWYAGRRDWWEPLRDPALPTEAPVPVNASAGGDRDHAD
ncbi:dTDP-glucose 4,6-dehydratase [Actinomadura harenae]|uniref:dTDP-glucose 4,6-dehydratase n=1 Tax=Actinomadura harenae TaxID=2483351 RepID=A0A3M2M162_9ACTN|nr:dTDP-glucose 4,6-dehydratase [Actinomadura harenae]RMI42820.1 dTDP-glucose 4,6-dehydratase [Actinomadura harenae]